MKHYFQPKSTRAKRKQERKKAQKEQQAAQGMNFVTKQQVNGPKKKQNRFGYKNQIDSFDRASSSPPPIKTTAIAASLSGNDLAKKKLDYETEKKLFAEKPELFEKRPIIIDGSNVAYA